jgi:hypothetical protein
MGWVFLKTRCGKGLFLSIMVVVLDTLERLYESTYKTVVR